MLVNALSLFAGLVIGVQGVAVAASPDAAPHQRQDGVRAIVAEMLADAETRSSLLQSGSTAGHDGRFFLADPAGNFRLNIGGQVQFRYTATFRDDAPGVDDFESGFTTTRTALEFDGHIFEPSLFYRVSGAYDRADGSFGLEDAYVGYAFENGLILIGGQLRMPVLWEDVLREKYSLAADQSVMNAVFRQDRSQGVWLHYSADDWRMWFGFSDGIRSENTDYDVDPSDWALTSRWELKLAGEWSQFDRFSSAPGSDFGAKIAAAAHWQDGPHGSPAVASNEIGAYTFDAMLAGDGWNAFAAFVGLYTEPATGRSFNDYGFMVQGGFFIPDSDWELFARYDAVIPDSDRVGDDVFNTITVGTNYYLHGHAAKFTFDIQWFLDETTENDLVNGVANSGTGRQIGLLPSADADQVSLRVQFQLLF